MFARLQRAYRTSQTLVESGAVDPGLVWTLPRWALSVQLSIPPLSEVEYDYAAFAEGASQAYETLNAAIYRRPSDEDAELLAATCTPQIARVLTSTAEELHGAGRELNYELEASKLLRRSLLNCVVDVFASERERDIEHTLRGYDDSLYLMQQDEREQAVVGLAEELMELRLERAQSKEEASVQSAEFDVLFESAETMVVEG
eukprot:CAMPEP_0119276750 /NCGR_PEP_ID=MMETSP1329-20130426/15870_1 /TAXON_ID=114041 /ORGANISM="Genus nov. species nov., Strain RCC1024" /LENGTH=201 /DNA_ID=CAMNT_0007277187 /DNA_START=158 /DNA_END=760 /DNA_ORIENTATION=+